MTNQGDMLVSQIDIIANSLKGRPHIWNTLIKKGEWRSAQGNELETKA